MDDQGTPADQYDQVAAAIVKAVPEIVAPHFLNPHEDVPLFQQFNAKDGKLYRPIILDDVLRAFAGKEWRRATLHRDCQSIILQKWELSGRKVLHSELWYLGHDLAWHRDNAPETIAFLHSLLVHD